MKKKQEKLAKKPTRMSATCTGGKAYKEIVANIGGPVCEKCFDKKQRQK